MNKELEYITLTDSEYSRLQNRLGVLEADACIRLLNSMKMRPSFKQKESCDYETICNIFRDFKRDFDLIKQNRQQDKRLRANFPMVDDRAIIESMYRKENGYHWDGAKYNIFQPIDFNEKEYRAMMVANGFEWVNDEWRKARRSYDKGEDYYREKAILENKKLQRLQNTGDVLQNINENNFIEAI